MRYYIVSWDNLGVEFFEEITENHPDNWAKAHLFDSIKQSKLSEKNFSFNLSHLKMRAQMNSHRHYEIYVFTTNNDIGPNEIKDWFTNDPQSFADWIRDNYSYKVYDNRRTQKDLIV
jgi:hypothetical protein